MTEQFTTFQDWGQWALTKFMILAERIHDREPQFRTDVRFWRTRDASPVHVYASFWSGDPQGDEAVVITLSIWRESMLWPEKDTLQLVDGAFRRKCDILVDNSDVYAELPDEVFRGEPGSPQVWDWLHGVIPESVEWAFSYEDEIVSLLHERRPHFHH